MTIHFSGTADYVPNLSSITVTIPEIVNSYTAIASGSLSLQVWLTPTTRPYAGGETLATLAKDAQAHEVGSVSLGSSLKANGTIVASSPTITSNLTSSFPDGNYDVTLLLVENAGGVSTVDDFVNFAQTVIVSGGGLQGEGGDGGGGDDSDGGGGGDSGGGGSGTGSGEAGTGYGAPLTFVGASKLTVSNATTASITTPQIVAASGAAGSYVVYVTLELASISAPTAFYPVASQVVGTLTAPSGVINPGSFTLSTGLQNIPAGPYVAELLVGDFNGDAYSNSVVSYLGTVATTGGVLYSVPVPTAPGALSASGTTSSGVVLNWQASTVANGGVVTDYIVYENSASIGVAAGTSLTVSGLASATSYAFRVVAEDLAGDSAPSAVLTVTTAPAGPSPTALPVVSNALSPAANAMLQQIVGVIDPSGATVNNVIMASGSTTIAAVSGALNALTLTNAALGSVAKLSAGYKAGYLLGGGPATLTDATGADLLVTVAPQGTLIGASNDTLIGGNGTNTFATGGATGTVVGGTGANLVFMSAANSVVTSQGADTIVGGAGSATVSLTGVALYFAGAGANAVGGSGGGTIIGGGAGTTVSGGAANEVIFGGSSLAYTGGTGAATIIGGGSGNSVVGGSGNLLIFASSALTYGGGGGAATIIGGGGVMNVTLGSGGGMVYGSPNGSDTLQSGGGQAVLVGGGGGDVLVAGGAANATLVAGGGAETLSGAGSTGNLVLFGGPGNDTLVGGSGGNLFIAESGNETLVGGGSSDSFLFINTPGTTRTDVIVGFNPAVDAIGLFGYGAEPGVDQAALQSATVSGNNNVVSLTDGTTIVFTGAPTLHAYNFF